MTEQVLFKTVCVGGPLDGMTVTEAVGKELFWYDHTADCQVMEDDEILVGAQFSGSRREYYRLTEFFLLWRDTYWHYQFWRHDSVSYREAVEAELFHPGDCHVIRGVYTGKEISPSPLFRYGDVELSVN